MEILQVLKERRDQVDGAIQALEGGDSKALRKVRGGRRGRPPAMKKHLSEIMKARWSKARKAGRNRL